MAKRITEQWKMYYPENQIQKPIICTMARKFNVITNIREYHIFSSTEKKGVAQDFGALAEIDIIGEKNDLDKAKEFLTSMGIKYEAHRI